MAASFFEESKNVAPLVRHDDIYFGLLAAQLKMMPVSALSFIEIIILKAIHIRLQLWQICAPAGVRVQERGVYNETDGREEQSSCGTSKYN